MKIITPIFSIKFIFFASFIALSSFFKGQTINITGNNWAVNVPTITEAGSNYLGTYDNPSQLVLSGNLPGAFLNLLAGGAAKVSMHYVATTWNNSLHIYAKRIGGTATVNGLCIICTATINNGTNYIEIPSAVDTTFFTISSGAVLGVGNSIDYKDVNVQLQIGGVSVAIPAAAYSAQIVFTIGAN